MREHICFPPGGRRFFWNVVEAGAEVEEEELNSGDNRQTHTSGWHAWRGEGGERTKTKKNTVLLYTFSSTR